MPAWALTRRPQTLGLTQNFMAQYSQRLGASLSCLGSREAITYAAELWETSGQPQPLRGSGIFFFSLFSIIPKERELCFLEMIALEDFGDGEVSQPNSMWPVSKLRHRGGYANGSIESVGACVDLCSHVAIEY